MAEAAVILSSSEKADIAATEKGAHPAATLNDTLSAVEKQVREKREKFGETWELPGNDPVSQEIISIVAAEESDENALE